MIITIHSTKIEYYIYILYFTYYSIVLSLLLMTVISAIRKEKSPFSGKDKVEISIVGGTTVKKIWSIVDTH